VTGHNPEPADAPAYDVTVIGAGIVGSAIARELAGHNVSVALVDARNDVGDGTSKANTAILHTGFDATPGTLESAMVRRGYELLSAYAEATGIPVERTGALLVAWTDEELQALPYLRDKAVANGYDHCEIVGVGDLYRHVPALGAGALGGLTVPDEAITCTWTTNLALATDAVARGTTLLLGRRVETIDIGAAVTILGTTLGPIRTRWVINAAGLGGDTLDRLAGFDRFTITPRRGELLVYDKLARPLVDRIVLPVPTSRGKGVLVSPTIYGNVMLGPTAEDLSDRTDTATSETGYEFLLTRGARIMPRLLDEEVTASYAGLRAASDYPDFLITAEAARRYVLAGGIRSTGLTSGMAVAEYVAGLAAGAGLSLTRRDELPNPPRMPNLGEAFPRPYQQHELIAADPAYGRILCFCERVTAGEIRDAFASGIPPTDLGGLRRRTRALNGRCQGFYCGAVIGDLVASAPSRNHQAPTKDQQ
jgi:glycerol-3-phosphate dehydrogenase